MTKEEVREKALQNRITFLDEYATQLKEENQRFREALEKILKMAEPGNNYAFNRCWHIASEVLSNNQIKET